MFVVSGEFSIVRISKPCTLAGLIERRKTQSRFSFSWMLAFFVVLFANQVFAQDDMIVTNLACLAQEAFNADHCLYLPGFPLYCQYFGVSLDGGLAWWVDCSQVPCTNLPPASTDASANALLSGVTLMPVQLTWNILTGETTIQPYGSTDVVAVIAAPSGYEPGGYSYDAGVWSAWQQITNCPDCWGIEGDVPPPTVSLAVYLADIDQYSVYESNCNAQADAYAAATTAGTASMMGGSYMSMDDDDDGGGGDPCSLTSLAQPFYITSILQSTNRSTTITWQSCQIFRYQVFTASQLNTNTAWASQSNSYYVWGQTNASTTSWTDAATTNDDGSTITQRFYRVQRLLGSPIAAGALQSLAVGSGNRLWAWGLNGDGELGDGTCEDRPSPVPSDGPACGQPSLSNVVAVAGGFEYSVAVDANGTVWSCGNNGSGRLGYVGDESVGDITPAPVTGVSNVVSVAAGNDHTLALRDDGVVFAWGSDTFGEAFIGGVLGAGYDLPSGATNSPIQSLIPTGTNIVAIAAGDSFNLALDTAGRVWGWGDNYSGQIGVEVPIGAGGGDDYGTNTPVLVSGISNVIAIAAGEAHSIALTADKRVWTWGDNLDGELGRSDTNGGYDPLPAPVPGLSNVVAIAGGDEFTLAVKSNGQVFAFGNNSNGQLGMNTGGSSVSTPTLVSGISNAVWVSAHPDGYHSLAVTVNQGTNQYYGWGNNSNGQVGNGTSGGNVYAPALVQFTNSCTACLQLGTSNTFTAYTTGTLTLWFNDDAYGDNGTGTYYTVTIDHGLGTVTVWATNSTGIAIGTVTNGVTYTCTASGYCDYGCGFSCEVDANGVDHGNHLQDCTSTEAYRCGFTCPGAVCYSLVGQIQ
jgi:alpha-tubulin suppressor-like RCC1 family protein